MFFECGGTVELTMLQPRLSYHTPLSLVKISFMNPHGVLKDRKDVDWVKYAECLWTKYPFPGLKISPDPHSQHA